MTIAIIDHGAELYWLVSNALLQDELPLKHLNSLEAGEKFIFSDLPPLVIMNGDDPQLMPEKFITKMRNHVFARNTLFIVVTADTSFEYKKSLLIAGAGQVIYRGRKEVPSQKFFRKTILWFMNAKAPDPQLFESEPVSFFEKGEFSTYGRVGWISSTHCLMEINLDLKPGEVIDFKNPLLEELGAKHTRLIVIEKNPAGRYYQYAHGYLCQIDSKNFSSDQKNLIAWIKAHQDLSKYKPVKVVYYEPDPENREKIKAIIKLDQRYCARGYSHLEHFAEDLEYQRPHLVLINRHLIERDKTAFLAIKKFMQSHFCYCITYDTDNTTDMEEYKKNFDFAMHVNHILETELFESMIAKLEEKLLASEKDDSLEKVFFNKYSSYSRISLHSPCALKAIAPHNLTVELPFAMSPYCAFGIASLSFTHWSLNRVQYFRTFSTKKMSKGFEHQCIFFGQTSRENELIKIAADKIKELEYDKKPS